MMIKQDSKNVRGSVEKLNDQLRSVRVQDIASPSLTTRLHDRRKITTSSQLMSVVRSALLQSNAYSTSCRSTIRRPVSC